MQIFISFLLVILLSNSIFAEKEITKEITIHFNKTDYLHRWHKGNQHEFTPKGQKDLKKWQDMLTVLKFPHATSEELLATTANNILGGYTKHGASVISTRSKAKTEAKPAEHLIVVIFSTKTHLEIVFNRLVMIDGVGHSLIYSQRMFPKEGKYDKTKWTEDKLKKIDQALMDLPVIGIPKMLANIKPSVKTKPEEKQP